MSAFTFDVSFQRAVLRLMMIDDAFCMRALQWIAPEHFTVRALGWAFTQMQRVWETYQVRGTETVLRQKLTELPDDKRAIYAAELDAITQLGLVPEAPYIRHELTEFCKRATFASAHRATADLFNQNQFDEAYDLMAKAQEKIVEIDFGKEDRQWFFEELGRRRAEWSRRADTLGPEPFHTGIKQLDDTTGGGVAPGELWVVFAYAKRCKSTWLINQGVNALKVLARPVLHFVLEGQGAQIAARYDACFSSELYTDVKRGALSGQSYRELQSLYMGRRQKLVIRTLNDWDVNVLHLQAELNKLRAMNFKPEMLIVDYMDLLRSRSKVESETQHQVNAARDLKRLVNQEQVACWSAWQAQRPKPGSHEKEHVLTSSNVADAYAKVRIVDAYGSLNATDEEMRDGIMRVFMEGHRDAPINQLYTIHNDLQTMRMITHVEGPSAPHAPRAPVPPPVPPPASSPATSGRLF